VAVAAHRDHILSVEFTLWSLRDRRDVMHLKVFGPAAGLAERLPAEVRRAGRRPPAGARCAEEVFRFMPQPAKHGGVPGSSSPKKLLDVPFFDGVEICLPRYLLNQPRSQETSQQSSSAFYVAIL
jgi:hypothetical protein